MMRHDGITVEWAKTKAPNRDPDHTHSSAAYVQWVMTGQ